MTRDYPTPALNTPHKPSEKKEKPMQNYGNFCAATPAKAILADEVVLISPQGCDAGVERAEHCLSSSVSDALVEHLEV